MAGEILAKHSLAVVSIAFLILVAQCGKPMGRPRWVSGLRRRPRMGHPYMMVRPMQAGAPCSGKHEMYGAPPSPGYGEPPPTYGASVYQSLYGLPQQQVYQEYIYSQQQAFGAPQDTAAYHANNAHSFGTAPSSGAEFQVGAPPATSYDAPLASYTAAPPKAHGGDSFGSHTVSKTAVARPQLEDGPVFEDRPNDLGASSLSNGWMGRRFRLDQPFKVEVPSIAVRMERMSAEESTTDMPA